MSNSKPRQTFQDIQLKRQADVFVGRRDAMEFFSRNLGTPDTDPARKFIVALSGQGGMGKTTLMARFRSVAQASGALCAWIDEGQKDLLEAMAQLADDLDPSGQSFRSFHSELDAYRKHRLTLESDSSAPATLGEALGSVVGQASVKLGRRIPVAGVAFDFVDEQAAADALGDVASFVATRLGNREATTLVQRPIDVLTPLWLAGLSICAKRGQIVLCIDTYEQTAFYLDGWFRALLGGRYGSVPGDIVLVIAGQLPLDANGWARFENLIERISVDRFSDAEAVELLERLGVEGTRADSLILPIAEGVPVLLATLATQLPADGELDEAGTETAVERFLKWIPDPAQRELAIVAALPRTINRDLVNLIGNEADQAQYTWLRGLPFVSPGRYGLKYHDVVRTMMLRAQKQESPKRWVETHRELEGYFRGLRDAVEPRGPAYWHPEWRRYELERVYHHVAADASHVLTGEIAEFARLWLRDRDWARIFAEILEQAEGDRGSDAASSWGPRLRSVVLSAEARQFDDALEIFGAILDSGADFSPDQRSVVLAARADALMLCGKIADALADLDGAVKLAPENALFRKQRAFCRQEVGDYGGALDDLDAAQMVSIDESSAQSVAVQRARVVMQAEGPAAAIPPLSAILEKGPHPWALLSRGQAYLRLGQSEAAQTDLKTVAADYPPYRHEAYKELGQAAASQGDYKAAVRAIEKSLDEEPTCGYCWRALTDVLADSDVEDPSSVLTTVQADSRDPVVLTYRANSLASIGVNEGAEMEYTRAVALGGGDPWLYTSRAMNYFSMDQREEAVNDLNRALSISPDHAPALALRGSMRSLRGQDALAVDDFRRAARLDPDIVSPFRNGFGLSLSQLGNYEEALTHFEQGLESKPGDVVLEYNRAVAIARWKGADEATEAIAAAEDVVGGAGDDLAGLYGMAGLAAAHDDADLAFDRLSHVGSQHQVVGKWLRADPAWITLREDPHFSAAAARFEGPTDDQGVVISPS